MTLLRRIKEDQLYSRKEKKTAAATILTTLIGEAQMIGKNDGNRETNDDEVVAVIKKFIKNNTELMSVVDPESPLYEIAENENDFLTQYLPTQLTEEQLSGMISDIITTHNLTSARDMGVIMKELKANYDGQYDGKMASVLAKDLINA